jgi:hypothetical protein
MKIAANIAGVVLGLLFLLASVPVLFHLLPKMPPPPVGSAEEAFMQAFWPTGYLYFVKIFEFLGALLVMIPKTRNFGLLVLGPIILNILAFHLLLKHGEGLLNPMILLIVVLALFLLWVGRRAFGGLLN